MERWCLTTDTIEVHYRCGKMGWGEDDGWCLCVCYCMRVGWGQSMVLLFCYLPSTNLTVYNGLVVVVVVIVFSRIWNLNECTLYTDIFTRSCSSHPLPYILRNISRFNWKDFTLHTIFCKLLARKLFTWLAFFWLLLFHHQW